MEWSDAGTLLVGLTAFLTMLGTAGWKLYELVYQRGQQQARDKARRESTTKTIANLRSEIDDANILANRLREERDTAREHCRTLESRVRELLSQLPPRNKPWES